MQQLKQFIIRNYEILVSLSFRSRIKRFFLGFLVPPWVFVVFFGALARTVIWVRERFYLDEKAFYIGSESDVSWILLVVLGLYILAFFSKQKFSRINSLLAVFSLFLITLYIFQYIDYWNILVQNS